MSAPLNRRALVARLRAGAPDTLIIAGLGSPAWDLAATGDTDRNFYLWGGMGQAVMVALGLAIARRDRRVVALTGDGEMLMGIGSLAAIGAAKPANLGILVLDNETYGETGGQPSATRGTVDLVTVAKGCGVTDAAPTLDESEVMDVAERPGPVFRLAKVKLEKLPLTLPPRDGAMLKTRMRSYLRGEL